MALPYLSLIAPNDQVAFEKGVRAIAVRLLLQPEWLMTVMYRESRMKPTAHNPSGATGLIQFMPKTAKGLGTSVEAIAKMTAPQQLPYVERYYKGQMASTRVQPKSVYDLYLLTLYPIAAGKPDSYVLFKKGTTAHTQNSGINPRGDITVRDVKRFVDGIKPDTDTEVGTATQAAAILTAGSVLLGVFLAYTAYQSFK